VESFLIAEKYVPKNILLHVAESVLMAQDIKERSWNGKSYDKTDLIAAQEATKSTLTDQFWTNIIHGWNTNMWNDAQYWAKAVIADCKMEAAQELCQVYFDIASSVIGEDAVRKMRDEIILTRV